MSYPPIRLRSRVAAEEREGTIEDLAHQKMRPDSALVRLGNGSIGGKARGVAFASSTLVQEKLTHSFPELQIAVPRTVVIGTDAFEHFVDENDIAEDLPELLDDPAVIRRFLAGRFSDDVRRDLDAVLDHLRGPLAIRSSGLLEDLQFQPFSGVYATYMLPNNHPDRPRRRRELARAIKAVYASTYCENARAYIQRTHFRQEEEKMGVIIQEMVGQQHNGRFYPHLSGVALSYNYYPIKRQRPEDGTVLVALGLGQTIVAGGAVVRFSPSTPRVLPQFPTAEDFLHSAQREFYALDMTQPEVNFLAGPESSLKLFDLETAELDNVLGHVGGVYSSDDGRFHEDLSLAGPRGITFNQILRGESIPLAKALGQLMGVLRKGMGCAVEIEFAVDMGDLGTTPPPTRALRRPRLYVLQIRPLATHFRQQQTEMGELPFERMICQTGSSLGQGARTDVRDFVYVRPNAVDHHNTVEIARQVGQINARLQAARRPYVLIGPGRWGSSDKRLGIPVEWKQIAGAATIAETPMKGMSVEPSQGTHFFQNITSLGVGYLTVEHTRRPEQPGPDFVDIAWLENQPAETEMSAVRHLGFEKPVRIYLDGRRGTAVILQPSTDDDPGLGI